MKPQDFEDLSDCTLLDPRSDKELMYVRESCKLSGETVIQRNYVHGVQVEQSETRRGGQVWFFSSEGLNVE